MGRGYRIAPITLDAWDIGCTRVSTEDAKKRGDSALQQQLADSDPSYSDSVFAYSEQLSKQIMGYGAASDPLTSCEPARSGPYRRLA